MCMSQTMPLEADAAASEGRERVLSRFSLNGIGGKVVALAVLPILFMTALSVVNANRTLGLFEATLDVRERNDLRGEEIRAASEAIKSEMTELLNGVGLLTRTHSTSLMAREREGVEATLAARSFVDSTIERIVRSAQGLKADLAASGLLDTGAEADAQAGAADADAGIGEKGRKQLFIVIRLVNALPNLFDIFRDANDRTISLIEERKFTDATANFIFEEEERLGAMSRALAKISVNLNGLSETIVATTRAGEKRAAGGAFLAFQAMAAQTYIVLAAFAVLLILVATWYAVRGLARPLGEVIGVIAAYGRGKDIALHILDSKSGGREIVALKQTFKRMLEDRERAEAALRESEARLAGITENVPGGVYRRVRRADGTMFYTFMSAGFRRIYDLDPEKAVADPAYIWSVIHPDDCASTQEAIAASAEFLEKYDQEYRLIGESGNITWCRSIAQPRRLETGDTVWDGMAIDITEQKKAEEEIRRLNGDLERRVEERTEELSETNFDLEREMAERGQAQAELLVRAYQQDVVVKLGQDALADSDLAALMNRATALVSQTLEIEYCSILELLRNGEQFWLRAGAGWGDDLVGQTTVAAGPETPAGFALRSGEPVIIEDLSTEKRFSDVFLLVKHKVVSGVSVTIEGRDRAFGVLEVHATGFRPFSDADIAFLQAVSNVLSAAVERKRAEDAHEQLTEQLYQSQKMEATGQLAAGVAHDFNNILMIIDGYTRRARNDPRVPEEAKEPLNHVIKAADKAAGLTKQLLVFGRRQSLETKVVAAATVLRELEVLLQPLLGETIELRLDAIDKDIFVDTDPGQLTQALVNLAINARDAMPDGGKISITMRRVEVDEAFLARNTKLPAGSYLRIDVEDEGKGIDEETIAYIFDPFFTTKEQGKGTELGLAMVYGFVDQCKGAVEVESEVGKGTTFNIYLPTVQPPVEIALDIDDRDLIGGGETILLAEDDDALRELVRLNLESLGYTVITARDGVEALEAEIEYEDRIDLLLSDVVMPNLGGIELARELKETRPDTKVLLMSGYPSRGAIKRIDLPKDIPLLHKPCPPERLARAVRDVLEGRRASQG